MYQDISVQIMGLIYVLILSFVYFLKRKYNFLESRVYKSLLICTIITLVLDITSMFIIEKVRYLSFVRILLIKCYFISLFIWLIIFIGYVFLNKSDVKYDNYYQLIIWRGQ